MSDYSKGIWTCFIIVVVSIAVGWFLLPTKYWPVEAHVCPSDSANKTYTPPLNPPKADYYPPAP